MRFAETELRAEAWDPLAWVYLLGDGIHLLLAREFAPLGVRLASAAERIEGIPAVLDAARARLVGVAGPAGQPPARRGRARPAPRDRRALPRGARGRGRRPTRRASWRRSACAWSRRSPRAEAALEAFATHLRDVVLPASEGEGRLGPDLFAAKLRHTLRIDMTPDELEARARREFAAVGAEMVRLARELWPAPPTRARRRRPTTAPSSAARSTRSPSATRRPTGCSTSAARSWRGSRRSAASATSSASPEEPLAIDWTPVFLRAFGGAMLSSPGPLDRGLRSYFYVTPPPDDWTPEQVESYLREDNDRMLVTLVIHEAVPGHYLQLAYANRSPSFVRAAFASGVFAEGWAVYVTQVMMDLGYRADDPALLLVHWKLYLRAVTNALIDVGIHARGMTEEEAVGLMVEGGFQERSEAVKKYERARLTSTQLCDVLRRLGRDVGPRGGAPPAAGDRLGRPARRGGRAGSRASSAGSARRPASPTGSTSRRSWPTARRRSRPCGGSCSGE